MEILGVKFAPFNIPFKRRVETACALLWICLCTVGTFVGLWTVGYLILFTKYYWLAILYLIWVYTDREAAHSGGRRFALARRLLCWKHFSDFFPIKLVKTCDLPNDKNYLFCVYPHGILSAGAFGHFATDTTNFPKEYPGLIPHLSTLQMHFNVPFFREILLSLGFIAASKEGIMSVLTSKQKGNVAVLVVGGAQEALYAKPEQYTIILKNRKGFIKLALKAGAPLVPVFSFGENDIYDQVANPPGSVLLAIQTWTKKHTGIAPCIPMGRGILQYSYGPVPRRCPVTTIIGNPIDVPHSPNPTTEEVEKYHSIFTEKIVELFEEHKHKYLKNPDQTQLIIE